MESWVFLLVGSAGAIGAALSVGTVAALVSYQRSGRLPGQPEDAPEPGPGTVRRLVTRIVVGALVAVVAVVVLAEQGLLQLS